MADSLSAISTPADLTPAPIYKISTLLSVIKEDTMMPIICYKQSGGWQLNESESCVTTTKNNNTIEVRLLVCIQSVSIAKLTPGVLAEMSSNKSDRSMSPSTLSEEGRRDLIARQHRALYGGEGAAFVGQTPYGIEDIGTRDPPGAALNNAPSTARGASPRSADPFNAPGQSSQNDQNTVTGQETSRTEKANSPSGQAAPGFGSFDAPIQSSSGKSTSPTSGEEISHSRQISKSTTAPISGGMGPIGSRPNAQAAPNQSLNKRTTSPLPSSLGYNFGNNEQISDRAPSSNSNSNAPKESSSGSGMGAWGTGSGVWGNNKIGTTSVWG